MIGFFSCGVICVVIILFAIQIVLGLFSKRAAAEFDHLIMGTGKLVVVIGALCIVGVIIVLRRDNLSTAGST